MMIMEHPVALWEAGPGIWATQQGLWQWWSAYNTDGDCWPDTHSISGRCELALAGMPKVQLNGWCNINLAPLDARGDKNPTIKIMRCSGDKDDDKCTQRM